MNLKMKHFQNEKQKAIAAADAILRAAEERGGDLTAAESRQVADHNERIAQCNAEIAKLERRDEYERTAPTVRTGDENWLADAPEEVGAGRQPATGRAGRIGARYRDLFGADLSNDGWGSQQEFLAAIHQGVFHPNLTALNEGTGSGGGYLVPTQFAAEMLDSAMEGSIVLPRARIYPMTAERLKVAGFDASTNTAASLFGGIEAQWLGESTAGTATNPKVRKIELHARKLALFASTSNEIAQDGLNLDAQLNEALQTADGWFLDYAFLRGTGAGQPLGVLNDPALITVTAETEQDADTIIYENVIKMLARLHPGCFNRAVWVINPTCIPQLLTLYVTTVLSGAPVPVLREVNGGWQLLTRPVLMTEKLPALGDKGDIILADFSQYAIGLRQDITIEKSMHLRFMEDETVWRAITRVDGQGRWNKAFTPANGSTQSWCVCLAAR